MAYRKNRKKKIASIVSQLIDKQGASLFGAFTVIIGCLGIAGWIPGMQFLGRIRSDFIPMAPSTALSFILFGAVQALYTRRNWKSGGKAIITLIIILVSIFGLLEVAELFTGISLNFEDVIFADRGTLSGVSMARMSPTTGGTFFITGISMLLFFFHEWRNRQSPLFGNISGVLGTLVFLIAVTYLFSYLLGIPFLYNTGIIPMAVTTASGFISLGISMMFNSGAHSFPGEWVSGNTTRARLLRVFLPLTILLVLIESALVRFQNILGINDALLASLMLVSLLVIISFVISQTTKNFGEAIDRSVVALQESEEKYRSLFTSMLNGFALHEMIYDQEGKPVDYRFIEINPAFENLTGLKGADIIGKTVLEVLPELEPIWIENYEKVALTGEPFLFEQNNQEPNKYFEVIAFSPKKNQFATIFSDITKRKLNSEKLLKNENLYRGLFNNVISGVAVYEAVENGRDFTFIDFNKAAEKIEKILREKVIDRKVTEVFPGIREMNLLETFQRVWKTGQPERHPVTIYKDNRVEGWRENYVYKLPSGEIVAIFEDITDRKRAEEEIKSLSRFPDENPHPVLRISKAGKILYASKSSAALLNTWDKSVGENVPPDWKKNIANTFTSDDKNIELETICEEKVYSFILTPIQEMGYVNAYGRDITERKRVEEEKNQLELHLRQQKKLESIGTLASGVAHEINNPITGVMNYAQLISERLEPTQVQLQEYAIGIKDESERIAEIVRNLLSFSRQDKQSHSPARITDIVESTLSLIRTVIRKDQIELKVEIPDDLPEIKCRSQQIQQVLMNLLTNARDAVNDRYPVYDPDKIIYITVHQFEKEGRGWLRTTVEDHGSGIPAEIREKIYTPFFTTKDRTLGTGLGLPISHGIVMDHHGALTFESEENKFTRFYLDLRVLKK